LNIILSVLQNINPALPQMFIAMIQQTAGGGKAGGQGMRSEAQPSQGGLPETMVSPEGWAAGGGSQG